MADKESMQPGAEQTQAVVKGKRWIEKKAKCGAEQTQAVVKVKRWMKKKATYGAKERPMVSYCCVLCGHCFDDYEVSDSIVLECFQCGGSCAELQE